MFLVFDADLETTQKVSDTLTGKTIAPIVFREGVVGEGIIRIAEEDRIEIQLALITHGKSNTGRFTMLGINHRVVASYRIVKTYEELKKLKDLKSLNIQDDLLETLVTSEAKMDKLEREQKQLGRAYKAVMTVAERYSQEGDNYDYSKYSHYYRRAAKLWDKQFALYEEAMELHFLYLKLVYQFDLNVYYEDLGAWVVMHSN